MGRSAGCCHPRAQAAARSRRPGPGVPARRRRAASGRARPAPAPPDPAACASKALAQASSTGSAAPASGTPMSRWPARPRSWIETPAPASMNSTKPLKRADSARIEPGLALQRAGSGGTLELVEARPLDRDPAHLVTGVQPGRVVAGGVEQRQRRAPEQVPAAGAAPGVDRTHAAGHRDRALGHHRARRCTARPLQRGRQPAHVGKAGLETEHVDAKGRAGHQLDHLLGRQALRLGQFVQVGGELGIEAHRQAPAPAWPRQRRRAAGQREQRSAASCAASASPLAAKCTHSVVYAGTHSTTSAHSPRALASASAWARPITRACVARVDDAAELDDPGRVAEWAQAGEGRGRRVHACPSAA